MNIISRRATAALAAAAATALAAVAQQQLNKEVVIERDIVPHLEQATRHDPALTIVRPSVSLSPLTYSDRAVAAPTVPLAYSLEPAAGMAATATSPYRGYVFAGWPLAGAGYSIINRSDLQLDVNAFFSHDRDKDDELDMRTDALTASAALRWTPLAGRTLTADFRYGYTNYSRDYLNHAQAQWFNNPSLTLGWSSQTDAPVSYSVGAGVSYFGFARDYVVDATRFSINPDLSPLHEQVYTLSAGIGYRGSSVSRLGLDVDGTLIHDSHTLVLKTYNTMGAPDRHARGVARFMPYYRYTGGSNGLSARVGLNLGVAADNGADLCVSPDVTFDWQVSSRLGLTLSATGGVVANTLEEVTGENLFVATMMSYRHSHIPVDAQLKVRVGPFSGASLTLWGGYARANDRLMPYCVGLDYYMLPTDVKGWHVGASLQYSYRDIVGVSITYQGASHGDDSGYYMWTDGARGDLRSAITVTPIRPLQIQVGYDVTYGRRVRTLQGGDFGWTRMHNATSLWASAMYRILDPLSAFARVSNILDHEYEELPGIPGCGLDFNVGLSYKF